MKSLMMASGPSPQSSTSPPLLDGRPLKKEAPDDEIKEFAETAMNELLGWYGYESRGGQGPRGPLNARATSPSSGGQPPTCASPSDDTDECSWCKNPIPPETNALSQSVGDRYCSELCFSQSRRATFKRAKTCDWCRHVRHTVSYVDFQEGATQLQFCSDKCLNQYKMHIFCRETQAHLDLNPHLAKVASSSSSASLITPDLWMKNCKSRSASPSSERSASPAAEGAVPPISPKAGAVVSPTSAPGQAVAKPQLPVISVTPSSKLMKVKSATPEERAQSAAESRREHRIMKANAKKRRSSRCASTVTSQTLQKLPPLSAGAKPQDLRTCSPPPSREGSPGCASLPSAPRSQSAAASPPCGPSPRLPPAFAAMHAPPFFGPFQDPRSMRPSFFPPPGFLPRPPFFAREHLRPPIPPPRHLGVGPPPSVTVLVPYPVVLPIPLPIPIPIPILNFANAMQGKKWPDDRKAFRRRDAEESAPEEPLDFTINQKKNVPEEPNEEREGESATGPKNEERESDGPEVSSDRSEEYSGTLENLDSSNPEQTLPRFKITRLGAKMSKVTVPKSQDFSESARPLRKRTRLSDVPGDEDRSPVVGKTRKSVQV